jgi:hypothetical protein
VLLKDTLKILNEWLDHRVREQSKTIETASKCLYHAGLVLPVTARGADKDSERVVVGLAAEMSKIFNTKTRTPFMVPLQTVQLSEVKLRLK